MGLIGVSETQYIFDLHLILSYCRGVSLIFLKSRVFQFRSVKKGPNDVKPCETFDLLHYVFFVRHFWLILAKFFK